MGELAARWFTEKEGGAEITRKLITLGKPHRGALNALNHLVNSLRKGIGPIDFARSRPSAHQLPPEYACIESAGGIVKTTGTAPPNCGSAMIADGMRFHDELDAAALTSGAGSYDVHPIVGFRQKMCPYMEPMRFNPRPSMADGRTGGPGKGVRRRPCFNPRPSMADGRTRASNALAVRVHGFNPRPSMADGRTADLIFSMIEHLCFNPRPSMADGRTFRNA